MELRTEWDLSPLLDGDDDPSVEEKLKEAEKVVDSFASKWKDRKDYMEKPEVLKEALNEYERLMRNYGTSGNVGYYFHLRSYQDRADSKIKAKYNKVEERSVKLGNKLQFFGLNISKIDKAMQSKFLSFEGLRDYRHFLETSFESAEHLLTESEEKIISLKRVVARDYWERMTAGLLSKQERDILTEEGKKEKKNFNYILKSVDSQNREVRGSAFSAVNEILERYSEIAEPEMNALMANKKINDGLRNFKRVDSSRLLEDDVDEGFVDVLLDSVSKRFDLSQRYYALKSKLMGVEKLKYHEKNVPYGSLNKKYSFEDATIIIGKVFAKLDGKFKEEFDRFLDEGRVDAFPYKGKQSGAFCIHNLISQPIYVLLNYMGEVDDILTFAHELGHGINNQLMKEKLNSLNFGNPKATSEVASTFMEDFVLEELMNEVDDELKLALMLQKLNDDVSTIFRQVAFYRFEQELHKEFREKGYLSSEEIGILFRRNLEKYLGEYVDVEGYENWWVYVPHFRDFFYVYSYASGQLISKAMQGKVRKDKGFIENVKEFLSAGTSDSPKNLFMKMGIDITKKEFWDSGLNEVEKILDETEELARKLGKV